MAAGDSVGDFEWEMRAGLVENCIYIPEKLATWRRHATQASQDPHTVAVRLKMVEMARMAYGRAQVCEGAAMGKINIEGVGVFFETRRGGIGVRGDEGKRAKNIIFVGAIGRVPAAGD